MDDDRWEMGLSRYLNYRINRQVGVEDEDLILRVQDGMNSVSYTKGPFGRHEVCLRGFAKRIRDALPVSQLDEAPKRGKVAKRNRKLAAR